MAKEINFTKDRLSKLSFTGDGREEYRDKQVRGLQLFLSFGKKRTGLRKMFYFCKTINGKLEREKFGEYPYNTIEEVRTKGSEYNAKIARGINPFLEKRIKAASLKSELTFKQLLDRYMNDYAKHNVVTWHAIELQMNRQASSLYAKKLSSITKGDLLEIFNDLTSRVSKISANKFLTSVRAIFNKGIKWELLDRNLAELIDKHPANKPRTRYITQKEMPKFLEAVHNEPNKIAADFILTALYTGARSNNVRSMRFEDIIDGNTWLITRTKNGKPQEIYLTPEVIEILQRRKSENISDKGFVFPSTRTKSGYIRSPHVLWHELCLRAEIKGLYKHDMRRTNGTWARKVTGADRDTIGILLGHDSREATAFYDIIENSFIQKTRIDTARAISSFGSNAASSNEYLIGQLQASIEGNTNIISKILSNTSLQGQVNHNMLASLTSKLKETYAEIVGLASMQTSSV